jgi:2-polyprenyl-3-methyl-5-hydroxy-6-metoxy-1,4-benzoquinol methylase
MKNHSLKKMLRLVGEDKRVIDFGCATGYFSQLLTRKGCRVTGIEINPDAAKVAELYCEQVIVADLDFVSVTEVLPIHEFDVAVFGDVLEHLRNPWKMLEETQQLLKPEGYIVASIPNIAHGAIRLALLQGKFEYTELGILDNTHLRFFTRKTVEELFERSGYFIDVIDSTKLPILSNSPLVPDIDENDLNSEIYQQLETKEGVEDLQFIVRAFSSSQQGKNAALNQRYKLIYQLDHSQSQLQQTQAELGQLQAQLQQTQAELERSQANCNKLRQSRGNCKPNCNKLRQIGAIASPTATSSGRVGAIASPTATSSGRVGAIASPTATNSGRVGAIASPTTTNSGRVGAIASPTATNSGRFGAIASQQQQTQAELGRSQAQQQQTQAELGRSQAIISGMESSSFGNCEQHGFD